VPKHNNLEKHMGKQQVDHDIPSKGLKKNEIYYDNNNKHVQNLAFFSDLQPLSILYQIGNVVVGRTNTRLSSLHVFHVLENSKPMVQCEYLKPLFEFLKVKNLPKKHCPLMLWGG
jgi:hypothetical protein